VIGQTRSTVPTSTTPRVKLAAIYPREGTLYADQPYVVLNALWVTKAEQEVAAGFLAYVLSRTGQDRLRADGFRDAHGGAGKAVSDDPFLAAPPPLVSDPPPAAVISQIQHLWTTTLRKRTRVLLLLDVSGSMKTLIPGTNRSRLDLATQAARHALEHFQPDDDVGVWTFTTRNGAAVHDVIAPIGPVGQQPLAPETTHAPGRGRTRVRTRPRFRLRPARSGIRRSPSSRGHRGCRNSTLTTEADSTESCRGPSARNRPHTFYAASVFPSTGYRRPPHRSCSGTRS
jgi:hypothetical protein